MITENVRAKNIPAPATSTRTRTEMHITTREMFVVRSLNRTSIAWCEACGVEVRVLTPDEAAAVAQMTAREIYRRLERGELHTVETGDGTIFVCCNTGGQR